MTELQVAITGWADGAPIPERFALGKPGEPMEMSTNISPEISWTGVPEGTKSIAEGAASNGVTPKGKPVGASLGGVAGANDYTGWFHGDPDMGGIYGGYDGPCPPWNDSIVHRYNFEVFALDVETLAVAAEDLTGESAAEAMDGHILATGAYSGTYTLNASLVG